jgi:hypothetical protein
MFAFGNVQGVAVAPQPRVVTILAKATFPLDPDKLRFVVTMSGVAGSGAPDVPFAPTWIR